MTDLKKLFFSSAAYGIFSVFFFFTHLWQFNVNREFQFWTLVFLTLGLTISFLYLTKAIFSFQRLNKNWLICIAGSFFILYFFMPPPKYIANDLLIYFFHAKMFVSSGLLPYLHLPLELSSDPAFTYVTTWSRQFFNYGPLWYGISLLGPVLVTNIIWSGFVYKGVSLVFYLASLFFLYLLTDKNKKIVFLSALNPAILYWGITGAHNDIVLLFFIISSLYLFSKENYLLSFIILALGALIKYAAFLFLPAYCIFLWKKRGAAYALSLSFLTIAIFYLPYVFLGVDFQKLMGASTLSNPRLSGPLFSAMYFFQTGSLEYVSSFPQLYYILFFLAIAFFAAILSFLFSRQSSDFTSFVRALFWSGVVFIVFTFWFQSWYVIWILPLYYVSYREAGKFFFFFHALIFYSLSFYIFSYTYSSAFGILSVFIFFGFLGYFLRAMSAPKVTAPRVS